MFSHLFPSKNIPRTVFWIAPKNVKYASKRIFFSFIIMLDLRIVSI